MEAVAGSTETKRIVLDSEDDVAKALVEYVADLSRRFVAEKGSFTVVLSGGSLIDTMRYLTLPPYKEAVDWAKWYIFWVDERVVPHTSDDSNYKLATDGFLSKVSIPAENILAINDKLSASDAADDYEARLRAWVDKKVLPLTDFSEFPKHDLMLLGMGPDGHVASLFPNRDQQFEQKRWVTYILDSPKPPPPRITYTFPVINAATEVAMVITGGDVADAVGKVLGAPNSSLPAAKGGCLPGFWTRMLLQSCLFLSESDASDQGDPWLPQSGICRLRDSARVLGGKIRQKCANVAELMEMLFKLLPLEIYLIAATSGF